MKIDCKFNFDEVVYDEFENSGVIVSIIADSSSIKYKLKSGLMLNEDQLMSFSEFKKYKKAKLLREKEKIEKEITDLGV